ncbi:ATP-binding protein (plasmid) [Streptomyces sp. NBC_00637]|uniref:ATP-binding protein n=1 Tax=Streptomyces sp. NBC_00637 TaxID=2903667 RepID=UPI002F907423
MSDLILAASAAVALAAGGTGTWRFRRKWRGAQEQAEEQGARSDRLAQQVAAAVGILQELTSSVLPTVGARAASGQDVSANLVVPDALLGTALADRLHELATQLVASVEEVRTGIQLAADHQAEGVRAIADQRVTAAEAAAEQEIARIQSNADHAIAQARRGAQETTRAAMRSLTTGVVVKASRLTKEVREGVRRHHGDDAYETLVELDHLAQQLLLTAQGYGILAGDRPSRRYPTTSITEVIRAAMGRIEGYARVQHHEQDVAVESRAVEAVIHTLAELMDNALRYSPPTANVYVSVEQGHHACLIHVDDAGLRMNEETLLWASRIMSGEQRDDITQLGAEPQTGLRVVSALAEHYGFRVDLAAPNSYQGTRATLVLPKDLVAAPAPSKVETALAVAPVRGDAAESTAASSTAATTASGLSVRQRGTRRMPAPVALAEPVVPGTPSVAAAWAAGSRQGREDNELTPTDEGH